MVNIISKEAQNVEDWATRGQEPRETFLEVGRVASSEGSGLKADNHGHVKKTLLMISSFKQ